MADPVFVDCSANTWTLIATNVTTGQIWRARLGPKYKHTYRMTGNPVPTLASEGMPIFVDTEKDVEGIAATAGIDIYIYVSGNNGRVRVDI